MRITSIDGFRHFKRTLFKLVVAWQTSHKLSRDLLNDLANPTKVQQVRDARNEVNELRKRLDMEQFLINHWTPLNTYLHDSCTSELDRRMLAEPAWKVVAYLISIVANEHRIPLPYSRDVCDCFREPFRPLKEYGNCKEAK